MCRRCDDNLVRVHPPYCRVCGAPFAEGETPRPCSRCAIDPPVFDRARAPFVYRGELRDALLALKFRRSAHRAPGLADLMSAVAGMGIDWSDYDFAAPVPLHPARLRERGYNPAQWLAERLLRGTALTLRLDVLERVRRTRPQFGLTVAQRRENVSGALIVPDGVDAAGASVLLVDDILTTGATASACAAALKKAGAARVDVVTVARASRLLHVDQAIDE